MRWILFLVCALWSVAAVAQNFPPQGFKEMSAQNSPRGTFKIVHYQRDPADFMSDSQLWLQGVEPGFKTQLLFEYHNSASCVVSADERFIAVNHHVMSGMGLLWIFVRDRTGRFRKTDRELRDEVHAQLMIRLKLKRDPDFDHESCVADAWLRDGILIGHLVGHQSGVNSLNEWYFFYNEKKNEFSWDLAKINRGAFSLVKRGQ